MKRKPAVFKSAAQQAAFDEFWQAYFLKKCKKDAAAAYIAAVTTTGLHRRIMAAIEQQTPEMMQRPPAMRPYAATWLRGERWEDEVLLNPRQEPEPPPSVPEMPEWKRDLLSRPLETT